MLIKVGLSERQAAAHKKVEAEMRAEALEKFKAAHDGMDYAEWKAKTGQHVGFSMNAGELFRRIKAELDREGGVSDNLEAVQDSGGSLRRSG